MRSMMLVALMTLAACGGGEAPAEAPHEEAGHTEAAATEAAAPTEAAAGDEKPDEAAANTAEGADAAAGGEKVEYVCPMHLTQKSDAPGECAECGMALEKKVVKAEAAAPAGEGAEKKDAAAH